MDTKAWWQSKTVWGGIVALLAGAGGMFGLSIGIEDQNALTNHAVEIASAIGGLIAIYGRVTAKKEIK